MPFYTEKNYLLEKQTSKNSPTITRDSLPGILSQNNDELPPMAHHNSSTDRRAAFYISLKKASFTVESAFILPLFLLACLAIFSMLDFYRIYVEESVALKENAKKAAMYAYLPGESGSPQGTSDDGYLTLSKMVTYRIPYAPFPLPELRIPCHARVHIWCGYLGNESTSESTGSEEGMVYVTDYESVYHTSSSCSHLDLHIYTETIAAAKKSRNVDGARYHPCEKCIGKGASHEYVYLSQRGTAYHNSLECSGLKRRIRLVSKDQISNLNICSRCQTLSPKKGA
ncbi:MAG TPA: hypothetical protein IAC62_02090 [Candidatus Pelethocola excrementipullorum]|nr:hypothetical protein [Candidatus Pelethocola excrementipullorum]